VLKLATAKINNIPNDDRFSMEQDNNFFSIVAEMNAG